MGDEPLLEAGREPALEADFLLQEREFFLWYLVVGRLRILRLLEAAERHFELLDEELEEELDIFDLVVLRSRRD